MNKKYIIMAAIALFFGSISVLAADYWLKSNVQTVIKEVPAENQIVAVNVPERSIVVAGEALNYGDKLTAENMREVAWAAQDLPSGAFETIETMLEEGERSALSAIELGEPVLTSRITGPGARPSLSALVSPGMRAMAISIDTIAGVSGFIVPGDHVDVMLVRTFRMNKGEDTSGDIAARAAAMPNARSVSGDNQEIVVTSQVLSDVKVLSIDQIANDRQADPIVASSATLELSPAQASLVSAAQEAGKLTLHLRRAGDPKSPFIADLSANGIDLNKTASFKSQAAEARKTSTSVRVRMGAETQTFEVNIEGIAR